jgi:hypothetical protein
VAPPRSPAAPGTLSTPPPLPLLQGVWTRHFLVEKVASLPGLRARLEAGAKVADVGCG